MEDREAVKGSRSPTSPGEPRTEQGEPQLLQFSVWRCSQHPACLSVLPGMSAAVLCAAERKTHSRASLTHFEWAHSFPLSDPHCDDTEDSGSFPVPVTIIVGGAGTGCHWREPAYTTCMPTASEGLSFIIWTMGLVHSRTAGSPLAE